MPGHGRPRTDAQRRRERALAASLFAAACHVPVIPPAEPAVQEGWGPRGRRPPRPRRVYLRRVPGPEAAAAGDPSTAAEDGPVAPAPAVALHWSAPHRGAAPCRQPLTMRPRQLATVVGVAFSVALLLNAGALERGADTSPFGARRTAALALLHPVAVVSHALGLDRPRAALDQAFGHSGSVDGSSVAEDSIPPAAASTGGLRPVAAGGDHDRTPPVAVVQPAPAPPPHAGAGAPPPVPPVPPPGRVPTATNPLRIWVGGDSVAGYLGLGVVERAGASGIMAAHSHYQVSTGLSRPDYYDWPARLEDDMRQYDPEAVVFLVGANDDQPILTAGGGVADFGSPGWRTEYGRRTGAVMDRLIAEHRMVVWVGQPVERSADFDSHMRLIADIGRQQAAARPGVIFVDSRAVFADAAGHYQAYMPDPGGRLTLMRSGDGVHFSPEGGRKLAGVVVDRILAALRQAAPPAPG